MTAIEPVRETFAQGSAAADAVVYYRRIRSVETPLSGADPFAAHVIACALAVSLIEAGDTCESVSATCGLDKSALGEIIRRWTPGAAGLIDLAAERTTLPLDEEETQLLALLERFRTDQTKLGEWVAKIVTRRAMSPRHLWQDLGLVNRGELTLLVARWFPQLAADNIGNMKWKKFFYRKICELEGFSLCAAPTCRECGDFNHCFGEESGESALARLSR